MSSIAFDHLTAEERLILIGELWDSLDDASFPVADAQKAELDHRLTTLDEDIVQGRGAAMIIAELNRRYS